MINGDFEFWIFSGLGGLLGLYFKRRANLLFYDTLCEKIIFSIMSIFGSFFIAYIVFISVIEYIPNQKVVIAGASLMSFLGIDALLEISHAVLNLIKHKINNKE